MRVYTVLNRQGEYSGVFHSTVNAAILYFMMNGNRGAYIGSLFNDWRNHKRAGARVAEYVLKEINNG